MRSETRRRTRIRLAAWHKAAGALACGLSLALAAGAQAQVSATGGVSAAQNLIVEITLNGVLKGEFTVIARGDGDYLLREEDLKAMGVRPPYGTAIVIDAENYFSLRAQRTGAFRFDEGRQALAVTLAPEQLPTQLLDLLPGRPQRVLEPRDNSAFLNYRLLQSGSDAGDATTLTAATELGIRVGDVLFRSESAHSRGGPLRRDLRYGTSLTHDNRKTLQRLILGDFAAFSGELGGGMNLGGVSFSKSYQIDPYFVRQPMAGFTAAVSSPAEAEIYMDGVRMRTEKLSPGQFELRNLNFYGGQRELAVVIRDRFGREERLEYPYYFTDQNLRAGIHEYSYNAGLQRQQLGLVSNDYGGWAVSAFHRVGLSDELTLGWRGEAERGRFNLGPSAVLRSDSWGVVTAGLSAGRSAAGTGWAGAARYVFQARSFTAQAGLRGYSPAYRTVGQPPGADRPRSEFSAGAGHGHPALGNINIDYRDLRQYQGSSQRSVSVGYSRALSASLSLLASVSRVTGDKPATHLFVAISYNPGRDFSANYFHESQGGSVSDSLQVGNTTPVGEGLGYRITGSRVVTGAEEMRSIAPSIQYNGPHGIYTAELRSERLAAGGARTDWQFGAGGGIAWVAGSLAFSRPVADSFGIVEVGHLPGIRVYHSAQEIGRTDAQGRIFLPNLGSYQANRVAIDDRDIPIEYMIGEKELNVSPPLRSGSLIRFEVSRVQALTGNLRVRLGAASLPAEFLDLHVMVNGKAEVFPTGKDGELYLENLKAGLHRVHFEYAGRPCEFDLSVPESQEMLIELGELHACEFAN